MSLDYLPFEQPIAEINEKIDALRRITDDQSVDRVTEIHALEKERAKLMETLYKNLSPWQIVQMARHPKRPHPNDLIPLIFDDFIPLEGDRHEAKAQAILGGLARLNGQPVMLIAHKKGRTVEENIACNFSCTNPHGFRKALRLLQMAERFALPVITFIDTKGAFPGIAAEEHNQSEAISRNLLTMAALKTPIVNVVIGEGCSGGALAIGVGDRTLMLENSYYSVISPEGCASILWRDAKLADQAADVLQLSAAELFKLGLIDAVITEPTGGAHQDAIATAQSIKIAIEKDLKILDALSVDVLLAERYERLRHFDQLQ